LGVGAVGEEGGEADNGGGMSGACVAHVVDGENVDGGARPVLSKSLG
jgi:hypothetical protein